jgi:hypothetical protein
VAAGPTPKATVPKKAETPKNRWGYERKMAAAILALLAVATAGYSAQDGGSQPAVRPRPGGSEPLIPYNVSNGYGPLNGTYRSDWEPTSWESPVSGSSRPKTPKGIKKAADTAGSNKQDADKDHDVTEELEPEGKIAYCARRPQSTTIACN